MAEKENIYGIKYEVDISELKNSTREASQQIKLANAEFKRSSSSMDNWAGSTEGLSAKIKQLNEILQAQKTSLAQLKNDYNKNVDALKQYDKKMEELKAQKEKAIEQYGAESKEVQELEREMVKLERAQETGRATAEKLNISILNQEAQVNKTQREIEKYNSKLSELQEEERKTASEMDKLKTSINEQESELKKLKNEYKNVVLEQGSTSEEAKKLASKIRELNGDLEKNKSKLNNVEKEADELTGTLKETGVATDEAGGGFTIMKGAIADLVANAIAGAISKIGEFVGSIFELSEATKEYRQMNAKLEGSANTFGYSVDFAKDKFAELYGYLGDEQMATNAISNLLGLGSSTDDVGRIVKAAIGVWSAYGDSIPIESLTESINETAQVGKVTGNLADALNWAGISEDDFNKKLEKTNDTKDRARMIADILNDKYGESKKTYDELTGSITEANRAELELKDIHAELGKAAEPVNTALQDMKTKALEVILPVVEDFAKKILDLLEYLKEHPDTMNAVTGAVVALATGFGILAGTLAIQGIITGVTKAIGLLNGTMMANPIFLIITAITALVAGFVYLWTTSESFRNFWKGLWEKVKELTGNVVDSIVNFFTVTIPEAWEGFKEKTKEVVESISQFFQNLWTGIVTFFTETIPGWIGSVIEFFKKIPDYIGFMIGYVIGMFIKWNQNLVKFITTDIPNFINEAIKWFAQLPGKIWTWLSNAISKTAQWASETGKKAIEAGKNLVNNATNYIKELPGKIWTWLSNAASKVAAFASDLGRKGTEAAQKLSNAIVNGVKAIPGKMGEIGRNIVQGLWNGVNGMIDWVIGKVKGFGNSILSGIKSALGIHSPSREGYWIGKMLDIGIGNAIEDGAKAVVKKAKNMSTGILKTMKDTLKEKVKVGYDLIENAKEGVRGTAGKLAGYTGTNGAAYVGATNTNNINFNQYNYSPKSLDSLEIYRNTRKQIKQLQKWKGGK